MFCQWLISNFQLCLLEGFLLKLRKLIVGASIGESSTNNNTNVDAWKIVYDVGDIISQCIVATTPFWLLNSVDLCIQ